MEACDLYIFPLGWWCIICNYTKEKGGAIASMDRPQYSHADLGEYFVTAIFANYGNSANPTKFQCPVPCFYSVCSKNKLPRLDSRIWPESYLPPLVCHAGLPSFSPVVFWLSVHINVTPTPELCNTAIPLRRYSESLDERFRALKACPEILIRQRE